MLYLAAGLGLIIIAGCLVYFAVMMTRGTRHRAQVSRYQLDQQAVAEEWRATLPESVVPRSSDPLATARELTTRSGGTVFAGVTSDFREWRSIDRQQAVLVLGPPRSGKTSGLIIPTILGFPGPVVSTSTKADILDVTAHVRARFGQLWLFDPSGTEQVPAGVTELRWTPVTSAITWDGAREMADAMVGATDIGKGVENATHWTESAKALLGPCLHAAALDGATILDVRRWVSQMDLTVAGTILDNHGAVAAGDDLAALAQTEERERSSIYSTTRLVLQAYGSDAVSSRCVNPNFDAAAFVRSQGTLYITAPSHLQSLCAPLVVGLLEEIRRAVYAKARVDARAGHGSTWPTLFALDEVANIAPIKQLPAIVSESGGQGLQVMACFQDLSQARTRWKEAADGFLTLFGAKVVFAGIGDPVTLSALSTMVGDWDRPYTAYNQSTGTSTQFGLPIGVAFGTSHNAGMTMSARREAQVTASEIANLPPGHALVVESGRWTLVETLPYHSAPAWQAVLASTPALRSSAPDELREGTMSGQASPRNDKEATT